MILPETYFVRHGRPDDSGQIGSEGRKDALRAVSQLRERGIGAGALFLSSDVQRALSTADIIADFFGARVTPSQRIGATNHHVKGIENLDALIEAALEEAVIDPAEGSALVVVAHAPLVAYIKGDFSSDGANNVAYGEVAQYIPGTWVNPNFNDVERLMLDVDIRTGAAH